MSTELTEPSSASTVAKKTSYLVGLDLGSIDDYTALCVLETSDRDRPGTASYVVTWLERWRHISYPTIAETVISILKSPPLVNDKSLELLVDATGVGLPVVQLLRRMGLAATGVTITAGEDVGRNTAGLTVPKSALVGALQVVVQTHRLKVAPALPIGRTLGEEMAEFTRRQNPVTGRNQFAVWREGAHDDLVLSVAMAVWRAESSSPVRFYS